jgi:hypothetical protein
MLNTILSDTAGFGASIDVLNPSLVQRIRRSAAGMNRQQLFAQLHVAIADAANAHHARRWEEAQLGEASAEAIVDCEYHDDLAAAWSLIAAEHQLITEDSILLQDGSVH